MAGAEVWEVGLVAATGLHAGFQLTVSLLVYPALAALPASRWSVAHDAHSRRITPLVGVVYLAVAVTSAGALLTAPSVPVLLAVLPSAAALAVTAVRAAPLHGRLGTGHDQELVRQLLRADRWRALLAVVALGAAVVPLLD